MIPKWNAVGVLPPVWPGFGGTDPNRAPYKTDLYQVIDQFATTPDRIKILRGFLDFRAELHKLGVQQGFQWLDGSFVEDIENLELHSPNDIDVVTFFHLPEGETQASLYNKNKSLFDKHQAKATFCVDAYTHILGEPTKDYDVRQISYWYSMWSHRRNDMWKGFIQVELGPTSDHNMRKHLDSLQPSDSQP